MRHDSWTESNALLYVKQQHVTTMQRLWHSFDVEQHGSARERLRQTCTTRRARITNSCQSLRSRTARTRNKTSDATPSILEVDDKPVVKLDTPEPSPVKNEKRKGSTKVMKDTPDSSAEPSTSRQGKATKKGSTSETARLKQAWSTASRCKNGYNKASMQTTILVQDIETGDSWKWARQDSGPLPLLKLALDALQEHAMQPFFRHVLVTDDPQTLLQLPEASLAQVLSDLDRVQGI